MKELSPRIIKAHLDERAAPTPGSMPNKLGVDEPAEGSALRIESSKLNDERLQKIENDLANKATNSIVRIDKSTEHKPISPEREALININRALLRMGIKHDDEKYNNYLNAVIDAQRNKYGERNPKADTYLPDQEAYAEILDTIALSQINGHEGDKLRPLTQKIYDYALNGVLSISMRKDDHPATWLHESAHKRLEELSKLNKIDDIVRLYGINGLRNATKTTSTHEKDATEKLLEESREVLNDISLPAGYQAEYTDEFITTFAAQGDGEARLLLENPAVQENDELSEKTEYVHRTYSNSDNDGIKAIVSVPVPYRHGNAIIITRTDIENFDTDKAIDLLVDQKTTRTDYREMTGAQRVNHSGTSNRIQERITKYLQMPIDVFTSENSKDRERYIQKAPLRVNLVREAS